MKKIQDKRTRNSEATKKKILHAAKKEFSMKGLSGARVDIIATRAKANKRMIYHYFGSKEKLFQQVVEEAYLDIRRCEQSLQLEQLTPTEALEKLVRFTWQYYIDNPEFIRLVNSENLHKGKHLKKSDPVRIASRKFINMVESLLKRGVKEGEFRHVDAVNLNITIAAISYYYFTNRYTGSIVFQSDLMDKKRLQERLDFNIETIMRLVRK